MPTPILCQQKVTVDEGFKQLTIEALENLLLAERIYFQNPDQSINDQHSTTDIQFLSPENINPDELIHGFVINEETGEKMRVIYLPEVKDWGVEQFTTPNELATYIISNSAMSNVSRLPDTLGSAYINNATNAHSVKPITSELLLSYIDENGINVDIPKDTSMSAYDQVIATSIAAGWNPNPNFTVYDNDSIQDQEFQNDMNQKFENRYVLFATYLHFSTSNPSIEQINTMKNYFSKTATTEELQLLGLESNDDSLFIEINNQNWDTSKGVTVVLSEYNSSFR